VGGIWGILDVDNIEGGRGNRDEQVGKGGGKNWEIIKYSGVIKFSRVSLRSGFPISAMGPKVWLVRSRSLSSPSWSWRYRSSSEPFFFFFFIPPDEASAESFDFPHRPAFLVSSSFLFGTSFQNDQIRRLAKNNRHRSFFSHLPAPSNLFPSFEAMTYSPFSTRNTQRLFLEKQKRRPRSHLAKFQPFLYLPPLSVTRRFAQERKKMRWSLIASVMHLHTRTITFLTRVGLRCRSLHVRH
jgi:hypothetical protein